MQNKEPIFFFLFFLFGFFVALQLSNCQNEIDFTSIPDKRFTDTVTTISYLPQDTVHDTVEIKTPAPRAIIKNYVTVKDFNRYCDSLRYYVDTVRIDSTSYIVARDSIVGKKLWTQYVYLGVPYTKLIEKTIKDSIVHSVMVPSWRSGLFLQGEIGGNETSFNYSVGASFISKKKWSAGYRYGINQRTHNLSLGLRIF